MPVGFFQERERERNRAIIVDHGILCRAFYHSVSRVGIDPKSKATENLGISMLEKHTTVKCGC